MEVQGRVDKAKAETEVKVARARAEAKVYETEATSSMLNEQALTNQMGESQEGRVLVTYIWSNINFMYLLDSAIC